MNLLLFLFIIILNNNIRLNSLNIFTQIPINNSSQFGNCNNKLISLVSISAIYILSDHFFLKKIRNKIDKTTELSIDKKNEFKYEGSMFFSNISRIFFSSILKNICAVSMISLFYLSFKEQEIEWSYGLYNISIFMIIYTIRTIFYDYCFYLVLETEKSNIKEYKNSYIEDERTCSEIFESNYLLFYLMFKVGFGLIYYMMIKKVIESFNININIDINCSDLLLHFIDYKIDNYYLNMLFFVLINLQCNQFFFDYEKLLQLPNSFINGLSILFNRIL